MKKLFLLVAFLTLHLSGFAQDSHTTDTDRKWWIPDHFVGQFAGNIGLFSVGPGYSYAKDKVQSDILYGYVPSFESNTSIHLLTVKTSWHPYTIQLSELFDLQPLRLGTGFSYSYGPQFYTRLPKRYPDNYYWWASSLRVTPFIGSSVSLKVGGAHTHIKRLEFYGELGTTDLDIVSKWHNSTLPLWDIWNLAFGTKLVF